MTRFSYTCIAIALFAFAQEILQAQCDACQYPVQLITNGDFQSGNSGFTTDYTPGSGFFCPLCTEGTYAVGINAALYHYDFEGSDHTNPPFGNFMIVNGIGASGTLVWCQEVNVQPGTDYDFSYWARDVANNVDAHPLAQLVITFNGMAFGDTLVADGGWQNNSFTWNSGAETSVEICIVNLQDQTGGNDFGLDDISMTGCHNYIIGNEVYAGEDQEVCSGTSIELGEAPVANFSYSWSNGAGLSSTSVANPVLNLVNNGDASFTEEYILTIDSASVGCVQSDTVWITVLPVPPLSLGEDQLICPGDTIVLDAGTGWDDILWSTGEFTSMISVTNGGWISVTTQYQSCTAFDEITISEVNMPVLSMPEEAVVCSGDVLELNSGGYLGTWSTGETGESIEVTDAGVFWFTYEELGCSVADTTTVISMNYPNVLDISDTYFCEGSFVVLDAGTQVVWNNGVIGSTVQISTTGLVSFVATNGPCIVSDQVTVSEVLLPVADLGNDIFICEGEQVSLDAYYPQNDSYTWSDGDSIAVRTISTAGIYSLTTANSCGEATDSIEVFTELCGYGLFIPNAFTPNGDEVNEGWSVQGFNLSKIDIYIYNRLGNQVFYTDRLNDPWIPDEFLVGDDAYNYFILATTLFGERLERYGHVYLLK